MFFLLIGRMGREKFLSLKGVKTCHVMPVRTFSFQLKLNGFFIIFHEFVPLKGKDEFAPCV